ncbi:MAG TPA: MoaD/ThiS family protein [Nevskiaceae bacterium]|nr:MoaD/ThiS family protein [Nevskiaceae bacterium]
MNIRFEFFGVMQRLAGGAALEVELKRSVTIADALDELAALRPELRLELTRCAVASGDAIVLRRDGIADGSTLALLPPVAGG